MWKIRRRMWRLIVAGGETDRTTIVDIVGNGARQECRHRTTANALELARPAKLLAVHANVDEFIADDLNRNELVFGQRELSPVRLYLG
jgi:hypothetical protein